MCLHYFQPDTSVIDCIYFNDLYQVQTSYNPDRYNLNLGNVSLKTEHSFTTCFTFHTKFNQNKTMLI